MAIFRSGCIRKLLFWIQKNKKDYTTFHDSCYHIVMKFDTIRIVLVATSHPGNIGSAARAMKTMGLERLYLVSPRSFPDRWANELAAGADDILQNAVVTDTLAEALSGCQLVVGTSARPRDIDLEGLTPAANALRVSQQADGTEVATSPLATDV